MYRAILFDFYGVINKTDPYGVWLKSLGLKREGVFHEVAAAVDVRKITLQEFFDRLGELTGQTPDSIRDFFGRSVDVNKDVVRLISQLGQAYKLGLLSNAPGELLRPTLQKHDLEKYFDQIFISGEAGYRKPDAELFGLAIRKMGVPAAEILFIDDLQEHIDGAGQAGITGIRFRDIAQLRRDLGQKLKVKL